MAKKVRDAIAILEEHGWQQTRQRGSHRQFHHPDRAQVVTVTGNRNATISVGQLADIRRKSGIKELR
ncbi:MAG TPA: type II toxin-antitoxin system HicA family toxin [Solirubrobacteraceae bacterium]|jgi:predicted RNA binding protein YcfA (HicA-like mRNA interferase family)|nr:type II toxin-antitoxin system HicA family toxin [Solirubrobacteraceae bacterium]